ncbi:MAG: nucleoside 2-deoxyribosyltransferase [Candidatus Diapherotrites archaeon]|nr:nucleoside 2-deoxyribosyltransferase [Candidatus Diapherotrites archaeon]
MKIYFSGSVGGGRADVGVYSELIKYLKKYGTVLTEHIGNPEMTTHGEDLSDHDIFERDYDLINGCDAVVGEVSQPSLGVGYELGIAESFNKRVLCLYRIGSKNVLSTMVNGNSRFRVRKYKELSEAFGFIDEFFKDLS